MPKFPKRAILVGAYCNTPLRNSPYTIYLCHRRGEYRQMLKIFTKISDKIANPLLKQFMQDQNLRDLFTKREFRITEDFFQRELISGGDDDDIRELEVRFHDGYGEITGKVRKKPLPFDIPFSARLSVQRVDFTPEGKELVLKVDEVKPFSLNWVTARIVGRVPFLTWQEGSIICDLARIPKLAPLFSASVKGIHPLNFVTLRDVTFQPGALVGRVKVVL